MNCEICNKPYEIYVKLKNGEFYVCKNCGWNIKDMHIRAVHSWPEKGEKSYYIYFLEDIFKELEIESPSLREEYLSNLKKLEDYSEPFNFESVIFPWGLLKLMKYHFEIQKKKNKENKNVE